MSAIKVQHERILLVSSHFEDHTSLRRILHGSPWELRGVFTSRDALSVLRLGRFECFAVICRDRLPDGDWKSLLAEFNSLADRPELIVVSRLADERLWAEVLNLGAFDLLLAEPFEAEEVLRVAASALHASRHVPAYEGITRYGPATAGRIPAGATRTQAAGSYA
jgi:DNA-binding NtrC family response regulator